MKTSRATLLVKMALREDQENISDLSNIQTISIGKDDPEQGTNSKPTSETHECFKQNATLEQNSVDTQCEGQSIVDDTQISCKEVYQESEHKENIYYEDSVIASKTQISKSIVIIKVQAQIFISFSRLTARKRVRRDISRLWNRSNKHNLLQILKLLGNPDA